MPEGEGEQPRGVSECRLDAWFRDWARTAAYISRIEANASCPSMQMIHELAKRLDVDPHWLATCENATDRDDPRVQLQAARARIRHLESKIEAVAKIIRD